MKKNLLFVILSVLLLSAGWLRISGLTLLAALVPLLLISSSYDSSRRSFFRMASWTALTLCLWSLTTIWWVWFAAPIGVAAATIVQAVLFGTVFMLYHYISKRSRPALANVILVCGWLAAEYLYLNGEISFPWLLLGNGFANDTWAVQWYEYTGSLGGSLWVLISNLLIFYAIIRRNKKYWTLEALWIVIPIIISLANYFGHKEQSGMEATVTAVQPNINPYTEKFDLPREMQDSIMLSLAAEAPTHADYILFPETAIDDNIWEEQIDNSFSLYRMRSFIRNERPGAQLITGASTHRHYSSDNEKTITARRLGDNEWYDAYNTALAIDSTDNIQLHHKAKLVIGVEMMPFMKLLAPLKETIVDLGGTTGQLGTDNLYRIFTLRKSNDIEIRSAAPICYESVYGEHFATFAQRGAGILFVITNDGWWGDTPGYKQHFSFSRLRAVETRRWVVRSANTGISGFISPRGDVTDTLGWDKRGTITRTVPLSCTITFYAANGDYLGRISSYILALSLLYFIVYRFRLKSHLIDK